MSNCSVYFCWKQAVNKLFLDENMFIEEKYQTLRIEGTSRVARIRNIL